MYKLIASALLAFAFLVSGPVLAQDQKSAAPLVRMVKNNNTSVGKEIKTRGVWETHIAMWNDTFHVLTVYTGGDGYAYIALPGDVLHFYYGLLSNVSQPVTIYSDDGARIYNRFVYDETLLRVTARELAGATVYTVY